MATSLALLLLGAGFASAQTTWQQFPGANASPPMPQNGQPGSRVVLFNKSAGDIKPVQATEPVKKTFQTNDDKPKKTDGDEKADKPKKIEGKAIEKIDPFRVRGDKELVEDLIEMLNKETEITHKKNLQDYAKSLQTYEIEVLTKPDTTRPNKPTLTLLKPKDVPVLEVGQPQPLAAVKFGYEPKRALLEPGFVVHRRLHFEEKNAERYGWDFGPVQPILSSAYFAKDVLLWPGHLMSNFRERYDTNAGKCLPGTPVAYYLYPPEITLHGGLWETAAVIGTVLLLP